MCQRITVGQAATCVPWSAVVSRAVLTAHPFPAARWVSDVFPVLGAWVVLQSPAPVPPCEDTSHQMYVESRQAPTQHFSN